MKKDMVIVSACLAGVNCRYDGGSTPNGAVIALVREGRALPVCPEQLGGLPTPRVCAEKRGEQVVAKDGTDVTGAFERGAEEALKLAQLVGAKRAILKSRSPSCGCGEVYDGTFAGVLVPGDGIFAARLKEAGVEVLTEEDL